MSHLQTELRMRVAPRVSALALGALALAIAVAPLSAQDRDRDRDRRDDRDQRRDNAFTWSGSIPSGRRLYVKNINGAIEVERSTSGRVEVSAEKRWRRGDPEMVRIEQKRIGDDVVICALFSEGSTCDERGIHTERRTRWNDRNDVSVHFVVRIPDGVRLDLSTVNGGVEVREVSSDVRAVTVNGSIYARSASGAVRAQTVNGSIHVIMARSSDTDDLEYETVNGAITVELPSNFGAQLELSTVNGRVSTDFPITISGTLSPRRLRGSIGDGRTRLRASTVNGSVTLKRLGGSRD